VFDNGVQPVRRLLTEHGFMVDLTSSHRLRIIENGAVLWREVRDLKVGDYLLTDFGTRPFPEEEPVLPALDFHSHEKPSGMKAAPLTVPSALTVPLAYLMGAFVGDGTLKTAWKKYTSRKKGDVRKYLECNVGFTGNRLETTLKSKLSKLFRDVFGQGCTSLVSPSRAGSFNLSKSNNALYRWFNQVGCDRRDGLPPSILGATKHSAIAFLRGFWDTDGSINNQGLLSLGQKGANATTLRQTQLLMQDLGIATTLSFGHCRLQGKRHARWLLKVRTREGRRRFAEMIGFTEPEKQIKLMGLVNRSFDSKKAGDRTKWPVAELYRSLCERYYKRGLPRKVLVALRKVQRGLQYVSDGAVGELLVRLSDQTDDRDLEHLRALYQGTRPHRISSLDDVSIHVRVFDLEVTGDHEYATAGFLSHNCEKSADIITTTYLNDDHRRNGTTVFCNLKNRDNPIFEPFVASVNFTSRRISNMNTINSAGGRGMAVEDHQEALRMMMNV
jgi:intein/homing endonuclease